MDKIPFIVFLYIDADGKRQVYNTDWPTQFISDFTDKEITGIGAFFICGVEQQVKTITDAFKICKG